MCTLFPLLPYYVNSSVQIIISFCSLYEVCWGVVNEIISYDHMMPSRGQLSCFSMLCCPLACLPYISSRGNWAWRSPTSLAVVSGCPGPVGRRPTCYTVAAISCPAHSAKLLCKNTTQSQPSFYACYSNSTICMKYSGICIINAVPPCWRGCLAIVVGPPLAQHFPTPGLTQLGWITRSNANLICGLNTSPVHVSPGCAQLGLPISLAIFERLGALSRHDPS